MLNQKAESDLQQNKLESCYYHLQKAQQLCIHVPHLKVCIQIILVTNHKQSCLISSKIKLATKGLKLFESNFENAILVSNLIILRQHLDSSLANTYLNISAIQSSLECHDVALQNIYLSIILLQHELLIEGLKCNIELQHKLNLQKMQSNLLSEGINFQFDEYLKIDRAQILIAAYHNLSLEMEFFKRNEEAQKIIDSAKTLSEFILQPSHALRIKLKEIADKQVSTRIQKVQNFNHRSISFDDRNSNSIHHTKSSKYHFQRQYSKDNNNSIQLIQNSKTVLKNTPSKLIKHQKFITEITQSKSASKINKFMNPLELSYTQD
ncbi:unnamed protein product (macronuclear) [Paramecium tetraurelia]|uniref:Uncharacterized protein n=1 Tax=Paramecium tetraurelia TaxID=5888 RepID=A0CQ82_PARTE|nr:uncharacterized protein GSPATT00009297001 [Paramecium tetraurelia]CAK72949.1 unnamed protein product [Paramecium tetraurelia]|eukprot:XP_001440346.1 hypothetical protein (macronuclear) [Paramecium tetraurelia strain d4-2]